MVGLGSAGRWGKLLYGLCRVTIEQQKKRLTFNLKEIGNTSRDDKRVVWLVESSGEPECKLIHLFL